MSKHNKLNKGFSLIELLVVIGIIAVLAGLTTFNFNNARMRARDVQRKNDLRSVQKALELYKTDNMQKTPILSTWSDLMTTLAPSTGVKYLDKTLRDPKTGTAATWPEYSYTSSDGTSYTMTACLESTSDSEATTVKCPDAGSGPGRVYKLEML